MKLIKKLLIITLLVSMLVPATVKSTKKLSYEVMLLSDENTESADYDDNSKSIKKPKSIQPIKAI